MNQFQEVSHRDGRGSETSLTGSQQGVTDDAPIFRNIMTQILDSRHVYLAVPPGMASSEIIGVHMAIQNQLRSDSSRRMCQGN